MNLPIKTLAARALSTLFVGTTLIACGGGASTGTATPDSAATQMAGVVVTNGATSTGLIAPTGVPLPTKAPAPAATGTAVTDVRIENTGTVAQSNVPVTFGQVFAVGDFAPTQGLMGRLPDGTALPLQVNVKARHADGSVRHAVISAVLPTLPLGVQTISLLKGGSAAANAAGDPNTLIGAGFTASVNATIDGVRYSASADDLIKNRPHTTWLDGTVANEWQVSAPLTNSAGAAHPHLTARFAIRWYPASKKARVDVTMENDWAYEPGPQNFTYDAELLVGGKQVWAKPALTHFHHARWRKMAWWGGAEPQVNVKHNTAYLIATRALPNYDQSLTVPEATLANLQAQWKGAITEPMGNGLAVSYMPSTGGRGDIGLLPSWAAIYVLSMDKRAKAVTLGTADMAGSWSSHYRDKLTDRPVSIVDFPYMTIVGRAANTLNPATHKYEAFPACASDTGCNTPFTADTAHQPAFAYLPYLVTGDYYYLEELQFWTMHNVFSRNAFYRDYARGLMYENEVRGQAWSMRTLSEAAYITPDADPLKQQFTQFLSNNFDWYNGEYTDNPAANKLGALVHGSAAHYENGTSVPPWQDDFFTSAIGHASDLGFAQANKLLQWKSQFIMGRMTGAGVCWIDAAKYTFVVRDGETSPVYATIGEAYAKSHTPEFNALGCASAEMAASLGLQVGEMPGYSSSATGFPSNLQPGLAYSTQVNGTAGQAAWQLFMSRANKPNYASEPQFAIVPR